MIINAFKYSNCLFAALREKKRRKKEIKIIVIPPWKTHSWCPHILWSDDEFLYDFHATVRQSDATDSNVKCYQELWYRGYIRKRPIDVYKRWKETKTWN